ncbi:MAG: S1 RNA-binding domain-containing protein [Oscillospiraceae bacterium]|nr:S1 RNA-binding domain-containing protein [Oscillospiraceae bacterium]
MKIEKGEVLQGKVTGIAKFGAFVELAPGKSGLVYISEISNTFVKEVSDFLTVGQEVTVKIVGIDEQGRINLSIKQALPPAPPKPAPQPRREVQEPVPESGNSEFEDKLKRFMKDSESRLSDIKRQTERHGSKRRK